MARSIQVITPVDGSVYVERRLAAADEIERALAAAAEAQAGWRRVPVAERAAILGRAVDVFLADGREIAEELSWQMGRPLAHAPGELSGFEERARHMIVLAADALADVAVVPSPGFTRFIRREPLGCVLVIAPWNYPYLTAVNSVVPALMAGNAVILKHSAQTPLCAERFTQAFAALPAGIFRHLHLSHADTRRVIQDRRVDFVAFTGSVPGGQAIQAAAATRFIGTGLELGGKDPAYVRADADLGHAAENLADGVYFNAGQSCCAIERIYVHAEVYDEFVDRFVGVAGGYRLGDPLDPETTLGPLVRLAAADLVRGQIEAAVRAGARALIDPAGFPAARAGTPYLAPQVLVGVDHGMAVMTEESFGPVVGI